MTQTEAGSKTAMQKVLDVVERVGNMVPHPVIIFLVLIAIVVLLSHVLYMAGTKITTEVIVPKAQVAPEEYDAGTSDTGMQVRYDAIDEDNYTVNTETIAARSLLNRDGIRFIYSSLIPSFMGFTAVGLMIAAMIGAGVAEESGLVNALIRKLVSASPRWAMTYILAFLGILASIAADAGYLVLIPLAGTAFLSLRRHPLAGLALGFAAVAGAFTVNMLIKPLDAVLVEFTNDAIALVDPSKTIGLAANLWFSIASVVLLTFVIAFITERIIEPRLSR
jgi:aminobenzoyl-glutamate transport protein